MSDRDLRRLTAALWVSALVVGVAGAVLTAIAWPDLAPSDAYPNLVSSIAAVFYATLGVLIVRRARNIVGWILAGVGLSLALLAFTSAYAVAAISTHPAWPLPIPEVIGAFSDTAFAFAVVALGLMLFVFPTGALPSPRWRPVVRVGLAGAVLTIMGYTVLPATEKLAAPGGVSLIYPNPLLIGSFYSLLSTLLVGAVWIVVLAVATAFLSLVIRYRSGDPEQRQQIKWVAFVVAVALALNVSAVLSLVACQCDRSPVASFLLYLEGPLVLIGLPTALTIAILRYGLYEIDVVINRAVVYGLLAAAFTLIYVGVVVGIGAVVGSRGSPVLTIVAAVVIALLFQPLRQRARRLANRLVYGERATPYEVLSDFSERVGGTFALEDVLQRMASILATGTGATRVDVWLVVAQELRPVARWPADAAPADPVALAAGDALPELGGSARVVPVRHGEEILGALAIEKPTSEALTPTEERLLEDLASQAGLVLRNVRLTADLEATIEELRASRRRLVEAQDIERRKIERNLHDGAQQQLVALSVQLGLLERRADDAEQVRATTASLRQAVADALDDLRDLARGIYPPLLADKGLRAALEAQGRKAAVPTSVEADGAGRYPQEIEAAVYFCALEAMQNVAKYAQASSVVIGLWEEDGRLVFEVKDDGRGFDVSRTGYGTGLGGMADRLDAIGGSLNVRSEPGTGTTVRGEIPVSSGERPLADHRMESGRELLGAERVTDPRPNPVR